MPDTRPTVLKRWPPSTFKLAWQVVAAGVPAAGAAGGGGAAGALPAGAIPIPAAGSAGAACCGGAEIAVLIAPIAGLAGRGWLGTGMFACLAVEKMAQSSQGSRGKPSWLDTAPNTTIATECGAQTCHYSMGTARFGVPPGPAV